LHNTLTGQGYKYVYSGGSGKLGEFHHVYGKGEGVKSRNGERAILAERKNGQHGVGYREAAKAAAGRGKDAGEKSGIQKAIAALRSSYGFDTIGRKGDNILVRKGYFYPNDYDEDTLAAKVLSTLSSAGIKANVIGSGNVWKPFRGGASTAAQSHWWVELKVDEQPNAQDTRRATDCTYCAAV
jgi:hypothetical protein